MQYWENIAERITSVTGVPGPLESIRPVGGGDINAAYRGRHGGRDWFIKLNRHDLLDMFEAEAAGLAELAASNTLRVPQALCHGVVADTAYLVLEWLELRGNGDAAALGGGLAAMHRVTRPEHGWARDNTIGSTPQRNDYSDNWMAFWRDRRLGYQLSLAARRGFGGRLQRLGESLLVALPLVLADHSPDASLLHGDLWSGNHAYTPSGEPVIFDPAVYFGDRETDLAMTELFGGFSAEFHAAYREHYPLTPGYAARKTLYNLYHVLNHFNLFGGGYGARAERMIESLLADHCA